MQLPDPALLKLLQICSPGLPTGGYSYSQGLEWAVHGGWIRDATEFTHWLNEQLDGLVACQDAPLFIRLYQSIDASHHDKIAHWDSMLIAMRETSELRLEETQRGRALTTLLKSLPTSCQLDLKSYAGAFAAYSCAEGIPLPVALFGFIYSWADSQTTAAVKLVPLGQSQGQYILYQAADRITAAASYALSVTDDELGYTAPAMTMCCSLHETQHTRLFRS